MQTLAEPPPLVKCGILPTKKGSMRDLTTITENRMVFRTGRKSGQGSAVLGLLLALLVCLGFSFLAASAREALLLRPVVRTGFQFVPLTFETVEVKDFLGVAHGFSPTRIWIGLASAASVTSADRREGSRTLYTRCTAICSAWNASSSSSARSMSPLLAFSAVSIQTPRIMRLYDFTPPLPPIRQPAPKRTSLRSLANRIISESYLQIKIGTVALGSLNLSLDAILCAAAPKSRLGASFSSSVSRARRSLSRAFSASAVLSRISSNSSASNFSILLDTRYTQNETNTSTKTPIQTSVAPQSRNPSCQSPITATAPPNIEATSSAHRVRFQRLLILSSVILLTLCKLAALYLERRDKIEPRWK